MTTAKIDAGALAKEYEVLRNKAPRRSQARKSYFVGHPGIPSSGGKSNRREEHLAIALLNLDRFWPLPRGGWFRLLDYQVPLKAAQIDSGIGKIDLLGVSDRGRLVVVELKVIAQDGGRSDPPPAALMEGLRYAAIAQADYDAIRSEANQRFGIKVSADPPVVVLLAPTAWWRAWTAPTTGAWAGPFASLLEGIQKKIGISIECLALDDSKLIYGGNNQAPRLETVPKMRPVIVEQTVTIGDGLVPQNPDQQAADRYIEHVLGTLWRWADAHHSRQLDGGKRNGRPPVLAPEYARSNVLVVEETTKGDQARETIRADQRHTYFASLRSSQALAQSLFGAIQAYDRFDLLEHINAECGRLAFYESRQEWALSFEHEVKNLGEPKPTSIDILLSGPQSIVAIECKLTEAEFGRCSRPKLKPDDPRFRTEKCDGDYHAQAGRADRCALTAAGIKYWNHLPGIFAWPVDRDQSPCLFGQSYQLARNALAAYSSPNKKAGHALIIYDANNPAFRAGGEAIHQWEVAASACLVPGLLRRLSWQRLFASVGRDAQFAPLTARLREKYGFDSD